MTLNIKATDFCDVSNSAEGVIKAINELQSGDTLIFPKNEYHFYKERCIHKVCHMTNTDSFKAPDKYFAVLIENKENITVDGCGSTLVIHGDMCAFSLRGCKNVRLVNFTVRYASPTNFEMEVVERSLNKITYKIPTGTTLRSKIIILRSLKKVRSAERITYTYTANGRVLLQRNSQRRRGF